MDVDVIVVGAGPVGLMLAGELRLAGVRPLVLNGGPGLGTSRRPTDWADRSCNYFSLLADPPVRGLTLAQPELERLLDERARELGAGRRRGHEVIGVGRDAATFHVGVVAGRGQDLIDRPLRVHRHQGVPQLVVRSVQGDRESHLQAFVGQFADRRGPGRQSRQ